METLLNIEEGDEIEYTDIEQKKKEYREIDIRLKRKREEIQEKYGIAIDYLETEYSAIRKKIYAKITKELTEQMYLSFKEKGKQEEIRSAFRAFVFKVSS
jgi:hypothetical protein